MNNTILIHVSPLPIIYAKLFTYYPLSRLMRVDNHLIEIYCHLCVERMLESTAIATSALLKACKYYGPDLQICCRFGPNPKVYGLLSPFSFIQMDSGALLIVGVRRIQRLVKRRIKLKRDKALVVAMASISDKNCILAKCPADIMRKIIEMVI